MKKVLLLAFLGIFFAISPQAFAQNGLKVGDNAPTFTAKNQNGKTINLASELKKGPVVLFFYRGAWCPHCNKQASQMEKALDKFKAMGARVIAVTPSLSDNVNEMVEKTKATFDILHDDGHKIMDAYDVTFEMDKGTQKKYKEYGLDLTQINGEKNGARLPVPATYIISQKGKIVYRFFNTDYTKRASTKELLKHIPTKH